MERKQTTQKETNTTNFSDELKNEIIAELVKHTTFENGDEIAFKYKDVKSTIKVKTTKNSVTFTFIDETNKSKKLTDKEVNHCAATVFLYLSFKHPLLFTSKYVDTVKDIVHNVLNEVESDDISFDSVPEVVDHINKKLQELEDKLDD